MITLWYTDHLTASGSSDHSMHRNEVIVSQHEVIIPSLLINQLIWLQVDYLGTIVRKQSPQVSECISIRFIV